MTLNDVFNISGSGMSAQALRLNTVASNIANAETVSSSTGETYRARHPVFSTMFNEQQGLGQSLFSSREQAGSGVEVLGVVESDAELQSRYEPDHPMANDEGYVFYPNVNVVEEMANMMAASRAYQTNVEIMNATKTMLQRVLTLGQ
jgi:flagellar basal-body rod protein FlgC